MSNSTLNKVLLIGNLGQDPELNTMPNGNAVANISLATKESWKDQSGQLQERTEWHKLTIYNRLAEIAGEYLRKGSQIYVEGQLRTRKWQDQQGQDRYTTEVVVDEMKMLGSGNQANYNNDNSKQSPVHRPVSQSTNQQPNQTNQDYQQMPNRQQTTSAPKQAASQRTSEFSVPDFDFDD